MYDDNGMMGIVHQLKSGAPRLEVLSNDFCRMIPQGDKLIDKWALANFCFPFTPLPWAFPIIYNHI